jgi:hypothetical protein
MMFLPGIVSCCLRRSQVIKEHLLTHLDYEEESIAPTLRRMQGWPLA